MSATGLRVGTFTSPDLHALNERIALNGEAIDDDDFTSLFARLYDAESVSGIVLTRFELLTVGALLHFSDEGVDVAVVEVGLGGTWDSTNVVDGDVTVLTNVDLDHTAVLGDSIGAIARDKVGIFRGEATRGALDHERHRGRDRNGTCQRTGSHAVDDRGLVRSGTQRFSGGRSRHHRAHSLRPLRGGPGVAARYPPGRQRHDGHRRPPRRSSDAPWATTSCVQRSLRR